MMKKKVEHEFALYYGSVSTTLKHAAAANKLYELTDKPLCHRIATVLRLHEGESFILFDANHHAQCTIVKSGKQVTLDCKNPEENRKIKPHITFLLPMLKREAFEDALYSLTELGINEIQPIITAKAHPQVNFNKEHERIERIVHAAAEQSKNFAFPIFKEPLQFEQIHTILKTENNCSIFFDPDGKPVSEVLFSSQNYTHVTLMVGPEGDCTPEEKAILKQLSFTFCRLTPTILRAQQAAAIAAGIVRSFFNK